MFKKIHNLHLWLGLITAVFILLEAGTGLLLSYPSLLGAPARGPVAESSSRLALPGNPGTSEASSDNAAVENQDSGIQRGRPDFSGFADAGKTEARGNLMGIVLELHEGRLGSLNIRWLIQLTAISIIILTLTGVYMAIKILVRR
ncbi:PepSY-associated TM helix domain-containing protein [Moorella sulfitireducens (nom. illeg.)]|uniref:PepSY-associated TM helix domain-containing protein n=1 Tax=Neomoorella sulfitireducens TaxID=2972948 RepID=UPI0021ABC852|nr:PepSY-associated TM helix domain-containing protein [Moorella sulfitireducens]